MFKSRGVISNKITHLAPQITRTQKTMVENCGINFASEIFGRYMLMVQKPKNQSGIVYPIHLQGFILYTSHVARKRPKKKLPPATSQRLKPRRVCKTNGMKGDGGADRMAFLQNCNKVGPRGGRYKCRDIEFPYKWLRLRKPMGTPP